MVLGLVLVCGAGWCCSHLSRLTPALVVRSAEQTLACGPTEVLAERRDQGETFLLSQNHAVVMLNVFSPAFWTADLLPGQPLFAVDRTKVTGPEGFLPGFTTVLLLGPTGETLASCPITDPGNFLALHYNGSPLASALPTEGTS